MKDSEFHSNMDYQSLQKHNLSNITTRKISENFVKFSKIKEKKLWSQKYCKACAKIFLCANFWHIHKLK